jgi:hypothetical protein
MTLVIQESQWPYPDVPVKAQDAPRKFDSTQLHGSQFNSHSKLSRTARVDEASVSPCYTFLYITVPEIASQYVQSLLEGL